MGPKLLVPSAFATAPVPRPPQPTIASCTRSLPAAWTCGRVTPASAEAATTPALALMNWRRDKRLARLFAEEKGVSNRLIEQARAYWVAPWKLDQNRKLVPHVRHVLVP